MTTVIGYAFLLLLVVVLASMSIRIVPEFRRLVVFRLGRCIGEKGPGLVLLIPFIDRGVSVDLREVFFAVPPQTCITADNASVSIDVLVYDKVIDSVCSVLQVQDFTGAARGLAITTLRAQVGSMILDDVLSKRDEINRLLHQKLDQVTDRWGIRVMAVEIREVVPPKAIEEAMTRQMAAERNRRAMVAEADGKREAAIMVAEGERQAAILKAEAQRQAAILNAEGYAQALGQISEAASRIDSRTMTLQYLETLKALGAGAASKFIIPLELVKLAQPLLARAEEAVADSPPRTGPSFPG